MNEFEFFRDIQLTSSGSVRTVIVTGGSSSDTFTPGSQEEFFNNVQFDESGFLKLYIRPVVPVSYSFSNNLIFNDCSATSIDVTYYTNDVSALSNGVILYTDATCVTPVNGSGTDLWYAEIQSGSAIATLQISSTGVISDYQSCI